MTEHLGYEKHGPAGAGSGNIRNGTRGKTVLTEATGHVEIDRGVLAVEDWAEIRRLHLSDGLSARAVARRLGVSRGAVSRALAAPAPPRYERRSVGSAVDVFEPAIRQLLAEFPSITDAGPGRTRGRA